LEVGPDELEDAFIPYPPSQPTHEPVVTHPIEEVFQVEVHHILVALLDVGLGFGDRLVGGAPRTKSIAMVRERLIPRPL